MDETWVQHFQPETKHKSKQWKHLGSPPPKEAKTGMSACKVMVSIFWDAVEVQLVDYLDKGHTIAYYTDLLRQLREKIKKIRRLKLTRGVFFYQDNAPAHTSTVAMAANQKCGFQLVEDPHYSPDLNPSDYYLFPKTKKELDGHHFALDDDVMNSVDAEGIRLLHDRWTKCVNVDYVEK